MKLHFTCSVAEGDANVVNTRGKNPTPILSSLPAGVTPPQHDVRTESEHGGDDSNQNVNDT